ncbi:hypothetical protein H9P43_000340 [Blastocladiella emersonii ATCC 22665]|nr:hypothetical protein H9P43_000340 [Blastocladiella emersonii ATCC 22665]
MHLASRRIPASQPTFGSTALGSDHDHHHAVVPASFSQPVPASASSPSALTRLRSGRSDYTDRGSRPRRSLSASSSSSLSTVASPTRDGVAELGPGLRPSGVRGSFASTDDDDEDDGANTAAGPRRKSMRWAPPELTEADLVARVSLLPGPPASAFAVQPAVNGDNDASPSATARGTGGARAPASLIMHPPVPQPAPKFVQYALDASPTQTSVVALFDADARTVLVPFEIVWAAVQEEEDEAPPALTSSARATTAAAVINVPLIEAMSAQPSMTVLAPGDVAAYFNFAHRVRNASMLDVLVPPRSMLSIGFVSVADFVVALDAYAEAERTPPVPLPLPLQKFDPSFILDAFGARWASAHLVPSEPATLTSPPPLPHSPLVAKPSATAPAAPPAMPLPRSPAVPPPVTNLRKPLHVIPTPPRLSQHPLPSSSSATVSPTPPSVPTSQRVSPPPHRATRLSALGHGQPREDVSDTDDEEILPLSNGSASAAELSSQLAAAGSHDDIARASAPAAPPRFPARAPADASDDDDDGSDIELVGLRARRPVSVAWILSPNNSSDAPGGPGSSPSRVIHLQPRVDGGCGGSSSDESSRPLADVPRSPPRDDGPSSPLLPLTGDDDEMWSRSPSPSPARAAQVVHVSGSVVNGSSDSESESEATLESPLSIACGGGGGTIDSQLLSSSDDEEEAMDVDQHMALVQSLDLFAPTPAADPLPPPDSPDSPSSLRASLGHADPSLAASTATASVIGAQCSTPPAGLVRARDRPSSTTATFSSSACATPPLLPPPLIESPMLVSQMLFPISPAAPLSPSKVFSRSPPVGISVWEAEVVGSPVILSRVPMGGGDGDGAGPSSRGVAAEDTVEPPSPSLGSLSAPQALASPPKQASASPSPQPQVELSEVEKQSQAQSQPIVEPAPPSPTSTPPPPVPATPLTAEPARSPSPSVEPVAASPPVEQPARAPSPSPSPPEPSHPPSPGKGRKRSAEEGEEPSPKRRATTSPRPSAESKAYGAHGLLHRSIMTELERKEAWLAEYDALLAARREFAQLVSELAAYGVVFRAPPPPHR